MLADHFLCCVADGRERERERKFYQLLFMMRCAIFWNFIRYSFRRLVQDDPFCSANAITFSNFMSQTSSFNSWIVLIIQLAGCSYMYLVKVYVPFIILPDCRANALRVRVRVSTCCQIIRESRKRNNFPSAAIQIHAACQKLDLALYALEVSIFIARGIRIRASFVPLQSCSKKEEKRTTVR